MPSLPAFINDAAAVASRNAEYPGDPFNDIDGNGNYNTYQGCNRAASCAPGIGINTGGNQANPKLSDWSIEDQDEAVRIPQDGQHIGGDAFNPASNYPSSGGSEKLLDSYPINVIVDPNGTPDFNDTLSYIAAIDEAAPGQGFGAVGGDPINRGDETILVGQRAWGTNTV